MFGVCVGLRRAAGRRGCGGLPRAVPPLLANSGADSLPPFDPSHMYSRIHTRRTTV
jgi:hypothetical protein